MKKIDRSVLPYIILIISLGGCNKDNSPKPPSSQTDLLTSHSWKPSSGKVVYISTVYGQPMPPDREFFRLCDQDNILTFHTNNTLVSNAGPTKCYALDQQQETGTWTFSSDEHSLTFTYASQPAVLNGPSRIKELSATKLELIGTYVQSITGTNGIGYLVTFTYNAIFVAQ